MSDNNNNENITVESLVKNLQSHGKAKWKKSTKPSSMNQKPQHIIFKSSDSDSSSSSSSSESEEEKIVPVKKSVQNQKSANNVSGQPNLPKTKDEALNATSYNRSYVIKAGQNVSEVKKEFNKTKYNSPKAVNEANEDKKNVEDEVVVNEDYEKYESVVGAPNLNDKIAFQVLEISNSFTPELSSYKTGTVIDYNVENGELTLKLDCAYNEVLQKPNKFTIIEDDETVEEGEIDAKTEEKPIVDEDDRILIIDWKNLMNIRKLPENIVIAESKKSTKPSSMNQKPQHIIFKSSDSDSSSSSESEEKKIVPVKKSVQNQKSANNVSGQPNLPKTKDEALNATSYNRSYVIKAGQNVSEVKKEFNKTKYNSPKAVNEANEDKKNVEDEVVVNEDYEKYESVVGAPNLNDKIAFQVLEISNSFTPELSSYKTGTVIDYNVENGELTLKLDCAYNEVLQKPNKFTIIEDDETVEEGEIDAKTEEKPKVDEDDRILIIDWKNLMNIRKLPENIVIAESKKSTKPSSMNQKPQHIIFKSSDSDSSSSSSSSESEEEKIVPVKKSVQNQKSANNVSGQPNLPKTKDEALNATSYNRSYVIKAGQNVSEVKKEFNKTKYNSPKAVNEANEDKKNVEDEVVVNEDYEKYESVVGAPNLNDKIAFQVLEISNSFTPELSSYKTGTVIDYNVENGELTLKLDCAYNEVLQKPNKFTIIEDDETVEEGEIDAKTEEKPIVDEDDRILIIDWKNLMNIRKLPENIVIAESKKSTKPSSMNQKPQHIIFKSSDSDSSSSSSSSESEEEKIVPVKKSVQNQKSANNVSGQPNLPKTKDEALNATSYNRSYVIKAGQNVSEVKKEFNKTKYNSPKAVNEANEDKKNVEDEVVVNEDYEKYESVVGAPNLNDKIAFQVLEISNSFTPELSSYKTGTVIDYNVENGELTLKLDCAYNEVLQKPNKFTIIEDDETVEEGEIDAKTEEKPIVDEDDRILIIDWKNLMNIRKLPENIVIAESKKSTKPSSMNQKPQHIIFKSSDSDSSSSSSSSESEEEKIVPVKKSVQNQKSANNVSGQPNLPKTKDEALNATSYNRSYVIKADQNVSEVKKEFNKTKYNSPKAVNEANEDKKNVEDEVVVNEDYEKYESVVGAPNLNDKIAFQVLEISNSFTPELSSYKTGTVIDYNVENGELTLKLDCAYNEVLQKPNKFTIIEDDETVEEGEIDAKTEEKPIVDEDDRILIIDWKNLMNIRKLPETVVNTESKTDKRFVKLKEKASSICCIF